MILLDYANIIAEVFAMEKTLEKARFAPQYFTRKRKMPFHKLLQYLLHGNKCASQAALNEFFLHMGELIHMTQQALSKARSHFDHSPFQEAFNATVNAEYCLENDSLLKRIGGYKLMAIDGSIIPLPNLPKLRDLFGEIKFSVSARASIALDVLNDRIVDAELVPLSIDERTLAIEHIMNLTGKIVMQDTIFIMDRGYASLELIRDILGTKSHFIMRVRNKFSKLVDSASMGDSIIDLSSDIHIRVIKFRLSSGEIEALITDVFDLPESMFQKLYFLRWPVEVKYDVVKNKLELPNFTGHSPNIIYQDFWISMLLANVAAVAKSEADQKIKSARAEKENKYDYQMNVNNAIASLRNRFAEAVFMQDPVLRAKRISLIIQEVSASVVPIRTDRKVPRKKARKVKYHHNKKSNV